MPIHSAAKYPIWGLVFSLCIAWSPVITWSPVSAGAPKLLSGEIEGRDVVGLELLRSGNRQVVLGTDGWLFDVNRSREEVRLEQTAGRFQAMDLLTLRTKLYEEFGKSVEIHSTQHFLVVQPAGSNQRWANQFESLHRNFVSYFQVRGIEVKQSNFPMVAIVYPDAKSFRANIKHSRSSVLGIYDRASNRISLYDHGPHSGGMESTICHEAAHQSAFNIGVHSRVSANPHWIVEGIGCIFQGPAFTGGGRGRNAAERCDPHLLMAFRQTYSEDLQGLADDLASLVRSDALFRDRESVQKAYVAAWALTFYLAEKREPEFAQLIQRFTHLPPFTAYSEANRVSDFNRVVGKPDLMLAKQIARFVDSL